jgi:hypothetical protein
MALFKVLQLNKTAKTAWLAGIIDSEGTVELCLYKPKLNRAALFPKVRIVNQNMDLLNCVKQVVNLKYYIVTHKILERKNVYDLLYTNQNAIKILMRVKPYLIVKKKHAEIVLDWNNYRRSRPYAEPYSRMDLEYYLKISKLQKKIRKSGSISKSFLIFLKQIGISPEEFDCSRLKKE